jgi:hypothetical protein
MCLYALGGRYDAALTTKENHRHWTNADLLSPNAAVNSPVRRVLRSRARYEVANNSYARGIVLTLANDASIFCNYQKNSLGLWECQNPGCRDVFKRVAGVSYPDIPPVRECPAAPCKQRLKTVARVG